MTEKKILVAAHIPAGSALYRELAREQEQTGQTTASIVRSALADRYAKRLKNSSNGKDNGNE